MSWESHSDGQERHVWPTSDLIEHDLDGILCDCDPAVEIVEDTDIMMVVHNAIDGRE